MTKKNNETNPEKPKAERVRLAPTQVKVNDNNPRTITGDKFQKLIDSILVFPQMLSLRPVVVDLDNVALGGNMRARALQTIANTYDLDRVLGRLAINRDYQKLTEAERVTLAGYWQDWLEKPFIECFRVNLSHNQAEQFIVKDNASFGAWDFDALASQFNEVDLPAWGLDVWQPFQEGQNDAPGAQTAGGLATTPIPGEMPADAKNDTNNEDKRPAWRKGEEWSEPLCDMVDRLTLIKRGERLIVCLYKKSEDGYPIAELKTANYIDHFATRCAEVIKGLAGMNKPGAWCIVTTPARRHTEGNFSASVCKRVSEIAGVKFYPGALSCKNKHRIGAEFTLEVDIIEDNVVVFDDILTTGSTIKATNDALKNKNVVNIVGINNN